MGLNQHASDLNSSSFTCTQLSFSKLGTPPDRRLPFGAPRPSKTRPPILITPYGQLLFLLSWYPMLWFQAETNRTMRKSPKIQPNHHKVCPWSLKASKSKDNPPVLFLFLGGDGSPPKKRDRQTDRPTHLRAFPGSFPPLFSSEAAACCKRPCASTSRFCSSEASSRRDRWGQFCSWG